jgi:hypothetical protein
LFFSSRLLREAEEGENSNNDQSKLREELANRGKQIV